MTEHFVAIQKNEVDLQGKLPSEKKAKNNNCVFNMQSQLKYIYSSALSLRILWFGYEAPYTHVLKAWLPAEK
jgi:hypothetical protein